MTHSLSDPKLSQMKLLMMYNESIKSFNDILHHLELKMECLEVNCMMAFVTHSEKYGGFKPKHKKHGNNGA